MVQRQIRDGRDANASFNVESNLEFLRNFLHLVDNEAALANRGLPEEVKEYFKGISFEMLQDQILPEIASEEIKNIAKLLWISSPQNHDLEGFPDDVQAVAKLEALAKNEEERNNIFQQIIRNASCEITFEDFKTKILPLVGNIGDQNYSRTAVKNWLRNPLNKVSFESLKNEVLPFLEDTRSDGRLGVADCFDILGDWMQKPERTIGFADL